MGAATLTVLTVSVLPLLALFERSMRGADGWSLVHWRNLASVSPTTGLRVAPVDAVVASVWTAAASALFAVGVGTAAARVAARRPGGAADRALLVPLGVSSTTIGLGLLLALGRPPIDVRGSWWLVPAAQALVVLPLVVRTLVPALRAVPRSLTEAAALHGVGARARFWSVELPLVRGALAAAAALAVVASLGEFGATVFLARTGRPTVPVAIERLMSRPAGIGVGQAMALSCVLALMCAVAVVAVDVVLRGRDDAGGGSGPTF